MQGTAGQRGFTQQRNIIKAHLSQLSMQGDVSSQANGDQRGLTSLDISGCTRIGEKGISVILQSSLLSER